MVFEPALSRTCPAGTVVQTVVAGKETCEPPAPFSTTLVYLSPYGPLYMILRSYSRASVALTVNLMESVPVSKPST